MFLVSIEIPDSIKVKKSIYDLRLSIIIISQGLPLEKNLHYFESELQKQLNLYDIRTDSLAPVLSWTGRIMIGLTVLFALESLLLIIGVKGQVI